MEGFALAESEKGEWAYIHYKGPDCIETVAITAITGALVMVEEADDIRIKERGGVVTPAYAFHGSTYVKRLAEKSYACIKGRSMTVDICDGKPTKDVLEKAIKASDTKSQDIFTRQMKGGIQGAWEPPELLK